MRMIRTILIVLSLLFVSTSVNATTLERGTSEAVASENNPDLVEIYRVKIANEVNGAIEVSKDQAKSWNIVGKVLYPTTKVSKYGYAAAAWVNPGEVAAAAVNSIHIKTGSLEVERTIFSILPKEFLQPPNKYRSFLSHNSSIYTDINAGESIFGGDYSPFVGNEVLLARDASSVVIIPEQYVPKVGDSYIIVVKRPKVLPKEIIFENRFGGQITLNYYSGERKIVGTVLRPVVGVGRFEGSKYIDPGRIRANHAGVIDVSVSPKGSLGGFQIVPALHGSSMRYVKRMTQWMVIGPKDAADPSLEGIAPFFRGYIHPRYSPDDIYDNDWEEKLLSRYLVEAKYEGNDEWQPMPIYSLKRRWPLPGWANRVFDKVAYIRIFFPVED
jgi:hypothetical protein